MREEISQYQALTRMHARMIQRGKVDRLVDVVYPRKRWWKIVRELCADHGQSADMVSDDMPLTLNLATGRMRIWCEVSGLMDLRDARACTCGEPAKWEDPATAIPECGECHATRLEVEQEKRIAQMRKIYDALTPPGFDKVETWDQVTDRILLEIDRLKRAPILRIEARPEIPPGLMVMAPVAKSGYVTTFVTGAANGKRHARPANESGPGLAARYPDATKGGAVSEPSTCDVGADWE